MADLAKSKRTSNTFKPMDDRSGQYILRDAFQLEHDESALRNYGQLAAQPNDEIRDVLRSSQGQK